MFINSCAHYTPKNETNIKKVDYNFIIGQPRDFGEELRYARLKSRFDEFKRVILEYGIRDDSQSQYDVFLTIEYPIYSKSLYKDSKGLHFLSLGGLTLLGIPYDKILAEVNIIAQVKNKRGLLIDTIGYSPNDYESIAKMRTMLSIKDCVPDMYLAVSASSKASDLRTIMKNYEVFDYSSIIVTKCDETEHIGNVISILQERNVPVAYITCGQQVPRDIKHADVMYFIEKLTDMNIDKDLLKLMFLKEENYTEGTVTDDGRSGR